MHFSGYIIIEILVFVLVYITVNELAKSFELKCHTIVFWIFQLWIQINLGLPIFA